MNQPTPNLMPKKSDSLIGPNMINLLNIDQERVKKAYEGVQGVSCDNNYFTERCTPCIFTGPEVTLNTPIPNKTGYSEKHWLNRNYQKEDSNDKGIQLGTFIQKRYPTNSKIKGLHYIEK